MIDFNTIRIHLQRSRFLFQHYSVLIIVGLTWKIYNFTINLWDFPASQSMTVYWSKHPLRSDFDISSTKTQKSRFQNLFMSCNIFCGIDFNTIRIHLQRSRFLFQHYWVLIIVGPHMKNIEFHYKSLWFAYTSVDGHLTGLASAPLRFWYFLN